MAHSRIPLHKIYLFGSRKVALASLLYDYLDVNDDFDSFFQITPRGIYSFFLHMDKEYEPTSLPRVNYLMFCIRDENEFNKLLELSKTFTYPDPIKSPQIIIVKNSDLQIKNKALKNRFFEINLEFPLEQEDVKYLFLNKLNTITSGCYKNTEYFENRKKTLIENEKKRSQDKWLWAQPSEEKKSSEHMIPFASLKRTKLWISNKLSNASDPTKLESNEMKRIKFS